MMYIYNWTCVARMLYKLSFELNLLVVHLVGLYDVGNFGKK
jgi:hypothetical protein